MVIYYPYFNSFTGFATAALLALKEIVAVKGRMKMTAKANIQEPNAGSATVMIHK